MNGTILLNYNENTKQVEQEEKLKFLRDLLEQMGVPYLEVFGSPENINLSFDQKNKLNNMLMAYNIQVIDDLDGRLKVYVDRQLIAEWNKCQYKLKRDYSQLDYKKQLYLEMEINYWSVFEKEEGL